MPFEGLYHGKSGDWDFLSTIPLIGKTHGKILYLIPGIGRVSGGEVVTLQVTSSLARTPQDTSGRALG